MVVEEQSRESGYRRAVLVGFALVVGWLLHDVLVVAGSAGFGLAARIVLRSLFVALAAGLAAWCLIRLRGWFAAVLGILLVGAALWVTILGPSIDPAYIGLAKSILLMAFAVAVLAWFGRAGWLIGLPVGVMTAAAATAARRLHWGPVNDRYLLVETVLLVGGAGLVFAPLFRSVRMRRAVTGLLVFVIGSSVVGGAWQSTRLPRPDIQAASRVEPAPKPNVLFISLDTVRADHLAPYGYFRSTMPVLEELLPEGFDIYTQARSTSSWTLPSHGSLLTGLMPSEHGATHTRQPEDGDSVAMRWSFANRLREDVPTLAEQLRGEGYQTAAIVANDTVLNHRMGLDRGFDHYDDRPGGGLQCRQLLVQQLGWDPQFGCLPYRDATTVTDRALSWLRNIPHDESFFLFLNYMDAHEPYAPPSPFAEAFEGAQPFDRLKPPLEMKSLQYDRELVYLDSQLERLWDQLLSDGRWARTVVVITSDHGEAFGEHGIWGHARKLYEELIRVPLFVKGADINSDLVRPTDRPIGGHEVVALISVEIGLNTPVRAPADPELVAEWYGSPAPTGGKSEVSEDLLAWLEGSRKVIVSSSGDLEVYDLDVDGTEQSRLEIAPERKAEIRQRARKRWEMAGTNSEAAELSPEMLSKLRALGYLPAESPGGG